MMLSRPAAGWVFGGVGAGCARKASSAFLMTARRALWESCTSVPSCPELPDVSSHSFRKTLATLIDDEAACRRALVPTTWATPKSR